MTGFTVFSLLEPLIKGFYTRISTLWVAHLRLTIYKARVENYPAQHSAMHLGWISSFKKILHGKVYEMFRKIEGYRDSMKMII